MNRALRAFFLRQERQAQRRNVLASALLTRGGLYYLARRGGLLFARVPLRVALHAAEVVVIANFLELGVLGYLLLVRSVAVALGALHWGALEPLRQRVRSLGAARDSAAIRLEVARYLRVAVDFGISLLILLVAWHELGPRPLDGFSIVDAYAIGCTLRAITEAVTRTYHAGAFALRRVYRPFWSLLLVDVVEVGAVIALWPLLGPWGFAVSQLLGGGCDAWLSLRYTRRAFTQLGIEPPRLTEAFMERARPEPGTWRRSLGPALGNLSSQVDALLIAALALAGDDGAGLSIAAGLHVLRPVLSLGTNWARLFYFDLSRLDGALRALLRERLERLLLLAAPLFALASAVTGVLVTLALAGQSPLTPVLWMVPLLAARSWYAAAQIQAFSRGQHQRLWLGGAVVALTAFAFARSSLPGVALLVAAPASLLVAAAIFVVGRSRKSEASSVSGVVPPLTFLGALANVPDAVTLHVLALASDTGARALSVARALEGLPEALFVTSFDSYRLLLACRSPGVELSRLVAATAGALGDAQQLQGESGAAAIAQLSRHGHLAPATEPPASAELLKKRFEAEFQGGSVLDARRGALARGVASPRELSLTLGLLGRHASGARPARGRGLRAAVYAPRGEAKLIFVPARDVDPARFAEFERRVFESSLRDSAAQ